jgi:hypothetical protein
MDLTTSWNFPGIELHAASPSGRCAICTRCPSGAMFTLSERLKPEEHCQSWLLCEGCTAAVVTEVGRSALRTRLRLRIAVGVVAANRRPSRRLSIFDGRLLESLPRHQKDRLVVGFVYCMFAWPPLVFLVVLLITLIHGFPR